MWGERGAGLVTFDDDICFPAFHDDVDYYKKHYLIFRIDVVTFLWVYIHVLFIGYKFGVKYAQI